MMRDDTKDTIFRATALGTTALRVTGAAMLVASLAACQNGEGLTRADAKKSGISEGLQIADFAQLLQTAPDEFSVITKRPLEMPDSFAALPAPNPGAPSTRDPDPQADARAALSIAPATLRAGGAAPSATEAALLASAGVADPSIRATLASEQATGQDTYLIDRIFPRLRDIRGDTDPDAIDANEERLRLVEAGIVPGAARPVGSPVALSPLTTAPVPSTPIDPGTGPALTGPGYAATPAFDVPVSEPADTTPTLIYLPE